MSAPETRLTRRFWLWGFLFVFLLHAFAVFWFGERAAARQALAKPAPFLQFSLTPRADRRLVDSLALRHPTLFALPSARGFSGGAWLNFTPEKVQIVENFAPPEWLPLPVEQLGRTLSDYARTNVSATDTLLAELRYTPAQEFRTPDEPVITRSVFRIEGLLTGRGLMHAPVLPSATHTDVLRSTVLSVLVNGEGNVESAIVIVESGRRETDQAALDTVRQFVFEPLPISKAAVRMAAPPTPGRVVFTWHVTNAVAVAAVNSAR
jgi:TonB family protein